VIPEGGPICIRLYVAGDAPNSIAAIANLKSVLERFPRQLVELEIIDVMTHPERAALDAVMVTPTLVKLSPSPERRLLGNLRDHVMLLGALGLEGHGSA
jgi:circadian clock protein KaiB